MTCARCGRTFLPTGRSQAAIAVFVLGDERIFSYWCCSACGDYTVECWTGTFIGPDDVHVLPPVDRAVDGRCVGLVRSCPAPSDEFCGCDAHRALHRGLPG